MTFVNEQREPLALWAVRAGMVIMRTDYNAGARSLVCEVTWVPPSKEVIEHLEHGLER